MWKIILLSVMVTNIVAYRAIYEDYKVFTVIPNKQIHLDLLEEMERSNTGFTFWKSPTVVNKVVDIMVPAHKVPDFFRIMSTAEISYQLRLNNLQQIIEDLQNDSELAPIFNFESFHTLERIYDHLEALAAANPRVQIVVAGTSYQGRQIKGVKVSSPDHECAPGIFIEGGMNGREWISPATVMYILNALLDPEKWEHLPLLSRKHTWYIFPVLNPDGYVYTHTHDRLWTKNLKPSSLFCTGINLNRNWIYKWNTTGGNNDPCSENYPGTAPFSEEETRTVAEYIRTISGKFYAYISFHSYSQHLMYPFAYTSDKVSDRIDEMAYFAEYGLDGMRQASKTKPDYNVGRVGQIYRPFSGSSTDYIAGHYNTPLVYIYDLRDRGNFGFLLPPKQINATGEEVLSSLIPMLKEYYLLNHNTFRPQNMCDTETKTSYIIDK